MPQCTKCQEYFDDFKQLALHVQTVHKKTSTWTAAVLTDVHRLDRKVNKPIGHSPYSEQDKLNREACIREISGENKIVQTICGHCRRISRQAVPVEFSDNPMAWRINSILVLTCNSCSNDNYRQRF
jgi:hypothetical protein